MPAEELAQRLPIISLCVNRCAAVRGQVREKFLNPFVVDFVNRGARLWRAHAFNTAASALTLVRQTLLRRRTSYDFTYDVSPSRGGNSNVSFPFSRSSCQAANGRPVMESILS